MKPKVVAMVMPVEGGDVDEELKTAFGTTWQVSSVKQVAGSIGLPVRGDLALRFIRASDCSADPARLLSTVRSETVVPMINLLKLVDDCLERGWNLLSAGGNGSSKTPPDLKAAIDDVTRTGRLPACDLAAHSLPDAVVKTLSAVQLRRAVSCLAWAVHHCDTSGVSCDLDDAKGPFFLGGVLPDTCGLKMLIRMGGSTSTGTAVVKTLTPYHVLAVRGFLPPGVVNLSLLAPKTAHRVAGGAMPTTAAMACVLACMRALMSDSQVGSRAL